MPFADKTLTCRDCGTSFTFTAGEQEFYEKRGLMHEPTRCTQCRTDRRRSRGYESGGAGGGSTRQSYEVTCANCGKPARVPFQPRLGKPVYCNDCYNNIRASV